MKKLLASALIAFGALFSANSASAQVKDFLGIANHVGVNLGIGTTGISLEAATPLTPFVQARLGMDIMPGFNFHVDSDVSIDGVNTTNYDTSINLDGSLKRVQGHLIFNVYPLGNRFPFFVAVGGYFGGRDLVKITGHAEGINDLGAYVEIGDYNLPLDAKGYAKGALRTNAFRPYFAIGTGRPCPVGRINFMWELGVQIQGSPYLWDDINKKKIDVAEFEGDDDTFQKIMDSFKVYPVLKFTISGRIF